MRKACCMDSQGLWWLTWQGRKVLCSEISASPAASSCQVVARPAESWPLPLRFCSITQDV